MKEIIEKSFNNILVFTDKKHNELLMSIKKDLPMINKLSNNFGKTQSQFMDNILTVSHPTPIRNIRQILAEINKSMNALKEAYYKNRKKEIEVKILLRDLETEKDELKFELLEVEIEEKQVQLATSKLYVEGAIRKISNYTKQYNNILLKMNVKSIDEIDFEKEEEEYHIKKAFEQGLNAARSNGGRIDEGNQIYLTQLGINGTVAQKCVTGYLILEEKMLHDKEEVTTEIQWQFLEDMYDKFKGSAKKYANKKGMSLFDKNSLLEDKRE